MQRWQQITEFLQIGNRNKAIIIAVYTGTLDDYLLVKIYTSMEIEPVDMCYSYSDY